MDPACTHALIQKDPLSADVAQVSNYKVIMCAELKVLSNNQIFSIHQ